MQTIEYGYGHTKESAQLVRKALKDALKRDIKPFGLKISVRKNNSGYGGPHVDITTNVKALDIHYQYIIGADGLPGDEGRLVTRPRSDFSMGRPHHTAKLVTPELTEKINSHIKKTLAQFGRDNDDSMTDYFDNTMPLFYGIDYVADK